MKKTFYIIIMQVIAIADTYIGQLLSSWTSMHYDIRPMIWYHVIIYICFGILMSMSWSKRKYLLSKEKIIILVCGIFNICIMGYLYFKGVNVSNMMLLMLGNYLYFGVSEIKVRRKK